MYGTANALAFSRNSLATYHVRETLAGRRTVEKVTTQAIAQASGTFTLGGDLSVNRLGFGAMRLTGDGVWGPPRDHGECVRVLRRAYELGVNFIDTADSYGPDVSEELIREALHPYPDDLVVATKAGLVRTGPGEWHQLGFPPYLRQECEMSLRRLGVDRIDLFQLHRIDSNFPAGRPARRARRAAAGGQDPPHRAFRSQCRPAATPPRRSRPSSRCRTCTTCRPAPRNPCSRHAKPPTSGSSRGFRWRRDRSPPPTARFSASPPSQRDPVATGAGMAAEAVTGDLADPRNVEGGASGGKRRGRRNHARRRGIRGVDDRRFRRLMVDARTARALVLEAPRRLAVRELPMPDIGDDDGLVRVAACGLCGTDHEQYTGELAVGFAFVPGHETVGVIEAVGPGRRSGGAWRRRSGGRRGVQVVSRVRGVPGRRVSPLRAARHRRHVRVHPGRSRARSVGRLRRIPVSRPRFHGVARSAGTRSGGGDAVQSAGGRNPLGRDSSRYRRW